MVTSVPVGTEAPGAAARRMRTRPTRFWPKSTSVSPEGARSIDTGPTSCTARTGGTDAGVRVARS